MIDYLFFDLSIDDKSIIFCQVSDRMTYDITDVLIPFFSSTKIIYYVVLFKYTEIEKSTSIY